MKQLLKKDLKSGYSMEVLLDDENHLAVKLSNKDGEFVGQLFASDESISVTANRMSNGEVNLTADEIEAIVKSANQTKAESEEIALRLLSRTLKTT